MKAGLGLAGRWLSRLHIGLLMNQYVNRREDADVVDVPLFVKFERVGGDAIGCLSTMYEGAACTTLRGISVYLTNFCAEPSSNKPHGLSSQTRL